MGRDDSAHALAGSASPAVTGALRQAWLPRRKLALGVSEHATPSFVLIFTGIVLGPEVLNLLPRGVVAQLDPVVSVALAVLGVFVGSGYAVARKATEARWIAGASVEAFATLLLVAGGMYLLLSQWTPQLPLSPITAALVFGTCAAASAALHVSADTRPDIAHAAHLADFDDIPVVVVGAIVVPLLAGALRPWLSIVLAVPLGILVASAGTLLFDRAGNAPERLAFVTGTIILLGGSAAYVSASPLSVGFAAGLVWTYWPLKTVSLVESDLRRLQHPLVAVLLVIAGASIQFTLPLLWIAAPLVLSRLAGKLLGSLITARILGVPAGLLATVLAPPGVLGIALALNVQQVLRTSDAIIVSAVTVAIAISELIAVVLLPGDDAA